jgi:ribosome recycling factor
MVSHRNSKLPLNQVAQVTVKDAQTLLVIPNDEEVG